MYSAHSIWPATVVQASDFCSGVPPSVSWPDPFRILAGTQTVLGEVFRGFSQSLQPNAYIVPQI